MTRRPKKQPARKPEPEPTSVFTMEVNGMKLAGQNVGGQWQWDTNVPGLAKKYNGTDDLSGIVAEFTNRALAGFVSAVLVDPLHGEQVKEGQ